MATIVEPWLDEAGKERVSARQSGPPSEWTMTGVHAAAPWPPAGLGLEAGRAHDECQDAPERPGPWCRSSPHARWSHRTIDGDARDWLAVFNRLPIVSIHYVVGRDGQVEAGVPESMAATHATGWNQRSIGIGLVNNGDGVDPFPPPQVDASRVLRHSDVEDSTFPVASFGQGCSAFRRKDDPGEAFPWDAFRAALTAGAAPPPG